MGDYIFRVVVPEEVETEERMGKERDRSQNFFQVMSSSEMVMTDQSWYVVRNTPGVAGFVGSHGAEEANQLRFYKKEINSILRSIGMSTRTVELEVEIGETVKIIEGAFSGLEGQVAEIDEEKQN